MYRISLKTKLFTTCCWDHSLLRTIIFPKNIFSYPLIRTCTRALWVVRNKSFSEVFANGWSYIRIKYIMKLADSWQITRKLSFRKKIKTNRLSEVTSAQQKLTFFLLYYFILYICHLCIKFKVCIKFKGELERALQLEILRTYEKLISTYTFQNLLEKMHTLQSIY